MNLRVAISAALAVHVLGGVYVWATYTPVRPILDCVVDRGDGTFVAHFGWNTAGDEAYTLAVGADNRLYGEGVDEGDIGQPETFQPGRTPTFPKAPFQVVFRESVTWELGSREIVATRESRACEMNDQKLVPQLQVQRIKPVEPPPKKEEPPPPKKEEPPPPKEEPKAETIKPKPKKARVRRKGQPKRKKKLQKKAEPKKAEPVPVTLTNVSLSGTGIAVQKGEQDNFGDPSVRATRSNSTQRQGDTTSDGGGDPGGTGTGPATRKPAKFVSPKVLSRPKVKWPATAPLLGRVVTVKLSLKIGKDGKVRKVELVKGAGGVFNKAAISVAKRITFRPGTRDGKPIELRVPWTVVFQPAS